MGHWDASACQPSGVVLQLCFSVDINLFLVPLLGTIITSDYYQIAFTHSGYQGTGSNFSWSATDLCIVDHSRHFRSFRRLSCSHLIIQASKGSNWAFSLVCNLPILNMTSDSGVDYLLTLRHECYAQAASYVERGLARYRRRDHHGSVTILVGVWKLFENRLGTVLPITSGPSER